MFIERPLATLPADHAERFVRAMFAPDQRFARAYHYWFRTVQGHNEPTAKLSTRIELHKACDAVLANVGDPNLHTLGIQKVAASWQDAGGAASYQPIGLFGYRALTALPVGAKIAERIASTSLRTRCAGPSGIAHCVGILEEHGGLDVLKTVFVSLAHKAQAAGHAQLFLFTPDHRLRGLRAVRHGVPRGAPVAEQQAPRRHVRSRRQSRTRRGDRESARPDAQLVRVGRVMRTWIASRLHRRRIAFAVTGTIAVALSTSVFTLALVAGASPHAATMLRLVISLPILYVGYSRYMLRDTLRADRAVLGRSAAELQMLARVGLAIGVATGLKLAIEPLLVTMLVQQFDSPTAVLAPLIGDFGYGPIATYLILGGMARNIGSVANTRSADVSTFGAVAR
ncbi:MAG: hypothetical protein H0V17_17745 [Deltaproteobacteria bacterium]|nr:hypothetical protein [Deltaproteobacteria bacterium]